MGLRCIGYNLPEGLDPKCIPNELRNIKMEGNEKMFQIRVMSEESKVNLEWVIDREDEWTCEFFMQELFKKLSHLSR